MKNSTGSQLSHGVATLLTAVAGSGRSRSGAYICKGAFKRASITKLFQGGIVNNQDEICHGTSNSFHGFSVQAKDVMN